MEKTWPIQSQRKRQSSNCLSKTHRNIQALAVLFKASLLFALAPMVSATTLLETSFSRVSQNAELVFEGTVIAQKTRMTSHKASDGSQIAKLPYTYFTFDIHDIIKGEYTGKQIELGFAGGSINNQTTKVSELYMPNQGERGIYFIESLSSKRFNPLYGWHQGHYIVESNAGQQTVRPLLQAMATNNGQKNRQPSKASIQLDTFKQNILKQNASTN